MRIEENAGKLPDIKKAADRASSVCRRQEFYLKVGVVVPKKFGMCDPCLREYFPGSRRCCEAAPDSAGKGFNNYFLFSNVSVMFIGYSFSAYCLVASSEYL